MQKHAARHTQVLCERSPFLELMGWVCLHTAHVSLKPPCRKFSSETGPKSETWAGSSLGHLSLSVPTLEHTFLSWLSWSLTLSCPALLSLLVSIVCFPPFPTEHFPLLDKEALWTKNSPKLEIVPKVSQGPSPSRA